MPSRRAFVALVAAVAAAGPVFADDSVDARAVVEELLSSARASFSQPDPGPALTSAVERAFDFDIWERFLLQKRAEAFSDSQRQQFRALLPGFLAYLYRDRFDRGMTGAPSVGDASKVRRDILVASRFERSSGAALPVDWRLRNTDGEMRVIDIMVAGTSFLLLKRDEFQAIIDKGGAEELLAHIRSRSF